MSLTRTKCMETYKAKDSIPPIFGPIQLSESYFSSNNPYYSFTASQIAELNKRWNERPSFDILNDGLVFTPSSSHTSPPLSLEEVETPPGFTTPKDSIVNVSPESTYVSETQSVSATYVSETQSVSATYVSETQSVSATYVSETQSVSATYVLYLKLEDDKYWIEETKNPEERLKLHKEGKGCKWTYTYSVVDSRILNKSLLEGEDVNDIVKRYMYKHGISNVRGGSYSECGLSSDMHSRLRKEIFGDVCYNCKQSGHISKHCPNK